jgi:hypothetical protein
MQAVIGETVKPEEFRVDQIRDILAEVRLGGVARPALIDGCIENRRFWRCVLAPVRVPLTVDSPSAARD